MFTFNALLTIDAVESDDDIDNNMQPPPYSSLNFEMQQGNINQTFRTYSLDSVAVYTVSSNKKLGNCNIYFKCAFHISKFEINHCLYNN